MRKFLILMFFIPFCLSAQVSDDFSDGDFLYDPEWTGDTDHFKITYSTAVPESQRPAVQLNAPGAGTSYLASAPLPEGDLEWHCWVKLSFNTSAGNYARFYLMADQTNLKEPLQGYFIQIGGSDDSVAFCRQDSLEIHRLLTLGTLFTGNSTNAVRLKVFRNPEGYWKIYADPLGGQSFVFCGEIAGTEFAYGGFTGFLCQYTSSNTTKFYFDDIYAGPRIIDSVPPALLEARAIRPETIMLTFDEPVEPESAGNRLNYTLSPGSQHPSSVTVLPDPGRISLYFDPALIPETFYTLDIITVKDLAGNQSGLLSHPVLYYRIKPYDLIFSEIMADPSPPFGLPECEYLELFNRSAFPISLEGMTLKISSSVQSMPARVIDAGAYLLICSTEAVEIMSHIAPTAGLESFNLPNGGAPLQLIDSTGNTVCYLHYEPSWYKNSTKAEGGWSLEMIDPDHPCKEEENWAASIGYEGGTPGAANSNAPVLFDAVKILRACCTGKSTLEIEFSESLDSLSAADTSRYLVSPFIGRPGRATPSAPGFNNVILDFREEFYTGQIYELSVTGGLKNCTGEEYLHEFTISFAFPQETEAFDLVINEILFNPIGDGVDFVELYNRSSKAISLQNLILASVKTSAIVLPDTQACSISVNCMTLLPSRYLVLSSDPQKIKDWYYCPDPDVFLKMDPFPSYNNDSGFVMLMQNDQTVIDGMHYREDMHFLLLNSTDGVSLERICPDRTGDDPENWHSAAETAGFATPGYQNSQYLEVVAEDNAFILQPGIFSPDSDGIDDQLGIVYAFDSPGKLITILVFDAGGRLARTLVNNEMPGTRGIYSWDGTLDDRTPAPNGIYIVYAEALGMGGKTRRFKNACVLMRNR